MTIETILWTNMPPHPQVKICSQCGEEFIRKGRNDKFCSTECLNQNKYDQFKNPVRFTKNWTEGDGELDGGLCSHPIDPSVLAMAEVHEDNRMIVEDPRRLYTIMYEELKHTSPEVLKQMKEHWVKRQKERRKGNYQRWDASYILGWRRNKYDQ